MGMLASLINHFFLTFQNREYLKDSFFNEYKTDGWRLAVTP